MKKILVIGSINTDMVVTLDKRPRPGETVLGNDFSIVAGGKGANQAVAAARAGAEVVFIAKIGQDDLGQKALAGYRKDQIDTRYILVDPEKPSGVAVILVDESSGQNSIVVVPGANGRLSASDIRQAEPAFAEAAVLLIQLEIPLETVETALQMARQQGVTTLLNPAPARPLSDDLLALVDIITPNESETLALTGIDPKDEAETRRAGAVLLQKVTQAVVITLGEKGAYYLSKSGEEAFVPAIQVQAADTTAAGDVFNGYLAAALAEGRSYAAALAWASRAAAISVTRKGAQPSIPRRRELEE